MELSAIKFAVDTTELDRAGKAIGELVTNVGKLDKAARTAAQTEAILARAAKDSAKANLDNAKAQDVRLKSTITADKADQQAATAIEKKTKATERATVAAKRNVDMLQLQNDTYDFILEGFSKGDAKVLAMAKATGQLSDQLKQVLTDIRQFSKNTFDQTETGLDRMVKSAKEASTAQGFLNQGFNLTAKQAKELGNDLDRLNIRLQHQGKSYDEIVKAQAVYKQQFLEEAKAVNQANNALATVEKQRKDVVAATNYLTQADQKMAAALNTSNAALDKAGTDSLVKYETALRKSGVSQDVATIKLAKYKAQLEQVQIQEQKRREQHLTRALAPQATDVVVSLWSGQNPLTVLLQQGGQVTDLFMQSGVAAEKFGEVVKSSMQSMLPSILAVVKGVGGLLVDGLIAAGNATQGFIAGIFGMTGAMDKLYMKLSENGPSKFGGMIQTISSIMTGVFAVGVGVVIAGLAMMAKGAYDSMIAVSDLNKAMVLGGNAFNMTGEQALAYADTLSTANASTLGIIEVMTEMSKVGGFTANQIALVSKAAISMQDYAGVAIKDTVKQFSELGKDPVKALLELAKKTGELTVEQIKSVEQLQKQGRAQDAVNLAMKLNAGVIDKQTQSLKDQLHPLEKLVAGWKILGRWMWNVTNIAPGTSDALELLNKKERLAKSLAAGVSENVPENVALRKEIELLEAKALVQAQSAANRQAVKDEADAYQQFSGTLAEFDKQLGKADASKMKRQDFINAKIQELGVLENAGKYKSTTLTTDRIKQFFKVYGEEWDKAQEKLGSKEANYFATLMREATNNTIAANTAAQELTKSEQKLLEVRSDPRFEKLTTTQKQDVISKYEAAIAAEKQTSLTEKLAEAEEHRLKLLGKSEGIGKQYYSDMQKLEEFAKVAGWSRGEVEELTRAVFMATPAWKDYEKALEEVNSVARKFNEDSIASQAATLKENESLDYRISLLGKTTEEQKALSTEYNRANKIAEVRIRLAKQLRDIEAEIEKAKKKGLPKSDYQYLIDAQVQARNDAAEQEKAINREVAVQAAEDYDAEFKKIKSTVSESITAALFDGGKAGSSKIKDYLKTELRKRITLSIDAFINPIMGTVAGALGFGGGSSAGGAGSVLSTAGGIGNLLGGLGSFGSTIAGGIGSAVGSIFGVGAGNVALGTSLGLGASSSTAAALAAAQAGGAVGGAGASSMGSFLSGAGSAMPYIGAAVALLSIISGMDDSGTYHTGGAAQYSAFKGLTSGQSGAAYNFGFGRVEAGQSTISAMETLSKSLVQIFDGIAKTFGKTAGYEVATAFADDTSEDGAWGAFKVQLGGVEILNWDDFRQSRWAPKEFGDGEEGYKQYLSAISQDTRKVLMDMDLPSWANKILSDLGESVSIESLTSAITQIGNIRTVFENLKSTFAQLSSATDSTLESLMNLSGGIDSLANSASSYYTNFYSDTEKATKLQNDLTKALALYNLALPETKDAYRALVEAQDVTTESGAKSYVALLQNSAMFSELIAMQAALTDAEKESIVELTTSVIDEINRLRGYTDTSGNNPKALIAEFDRLTNLARGGDANAFNSLGETSKLLDEYYKNTATSAVQYAYQRSVLANSLEQSYNTARAGGATFSRTSSLMGTPTLSTPVVSSVSSANAAGSSGIADLLSAVVTELTMLRAEVRADVAHNAKTAKILERVTPEGDALATRTEG